MIKTSSLGGVKYRDENVCTLPTKKSNLSSIFRLDLEMYITVMTTLGTIEFITPMLKLISQLTCMISDRDASLCASHVLKC